MKKKLSKLFSIFTIIILSFAMVTTAVASQESGVASATPAETIKIYFDNSYTDWDEVSVYYFGNVSNEWPGEPMQKDDSGKYYTQIPKKATSIVINNNGKGDQSTDISNLSDNDEYVGIQSIGGKVLMIKKVDGKIPEVPTTGYTTPKQINAHVGNDYS